MLAKSAFYYTDDDIEGGDASDTWRRQQLAAKEAAALAAEDAAEEAAAEEAAAANATPQRHGVHWKDQVRDQQRSMQQAGEPSANKSAPAPAPPKGAPPSRHVPPRIAKVRSRYLDPPARFTTERAAAHSAAWKAKREDRAASYEATARCGSTKVAMGVDDASPVRMPAAARRVLLAPAQRLQFASDSGSATGASNLEKSVAYRRAVVEQAMTDAEAAKHPQRPGDIATGQHAFKGANLNRKIKSRPAFFNLYAAADPSLTRPLPAPPAAPSTDSRGSTNVMAAPSSKSATSLALPRPVAPLVVIKPRPGGGCVADVEQKSPSAIISRPAGRGGGGGPGGAAARVAPAGPGPGGLQASTAQRAACLQQRVMEDYCVGGDGVARSAFPGARDNFLDCHSVNGALERVQERVEGRITRVPRWVRT